MSVLLFVGRCCLAYTGIMIMLKTILAAATVTILFAAAPAQAAMLECNDDGMMKVEMMMKDAMKMEAKKEASTMAMKENEMAMTAKKDGKMDDCAKHLNMAQEVLMK
jgi:hypothetical protein